MISVAGDNDGDMDVITVASNNGNAPSSYVWLNDGAGVFSAFVGSMDLTAPKTSEPGNKAVVMADLNGDGFLDVLIGSI
jgi:hypothetical protein